MKDFRSALTDVTLYGYKTGNAYDWQTNMYYEVGPDNLQSKMRMPDVTCKAEIAVGWLGALDALLAFDRDHPCALLPDGSEMQLKLLEDIHPYNPHYTDLL